MEAHHAGGLDAGGVESCGAAEESGHHLEYRCLFVEEQNVETGTDFLGRPVFVLRAAPRNQINARCTVSESSMAECSIRDESMNRPRIRHQALQSPQVNHKS